MLYSYWMKRLWLGVNLGLLMAASSATAFAAQSSSPGYQVNEVQFGPGGLLNASSANYQAQQNLRSTAAGSVASPNYGAEAGFLTPNVPFLEMTVTPATMNLGTLSAGSTAIGTASFSVRAFVNSGYTVVTMNDPPKNESGYTLNNLTTPAASSIGNEQFGMNLVANQTTCPTAAPANFGANPVLVPSSTFASGGAASGYDTCGLFKYVKGDTVARTSGKGWGQTNYTISYIVNINAASSRAGTYTMTQDLVAVATY